MSERAAAVTGTDRFLIGIVAGAVLLVLAGVAAVFLAGRAPATPTADPDSPAGVVQAYVEAVRAASPDRAYALLSREAQAATSLDQYRRQLLRPYAPEDSDVRLLIEPATVGADTAEVKVTISRFAPRPEPFSAGTYHRTVTVQLAKEDGVWRIKQPTAPFAFLS
jgi:hypothetical protein